MSSTVTDYQAWQLQVAATTTGSLSLIASLCTLALPLVASGPRKSLSYVSVAILAFFNAFASFTYALGRVFINDSMEEDIVVSPACKFQGILLNFSDTASFFWMMAMAIFLLRTVTSLNSGPTNQLDLAKDARWRDMFPPLLAVVCLSLVFTIIPVYMNAYGPATLWCWISDLKTGLLVFYLPLMIVWVISIVILIYAGVIVRSRVRLARSEIERENISQREHALPLSSEDEDAHASIRDRSKKVTRRMMWQLFIFVLMFVVFTWFGLANRLVAFIMNGQTVYWLVLTHAIMMPLQGVANACVFGVFAVRGQGWKRREWLLRRKQTVSRRSGIPMIRMLSKSKTGSKLPILKRAKASIFAATWNVGEKDPPPLDALARWLPIGRDAYMIGLQECLHPSDRWEPAIRKALASHGGMSDGAKQDYVLVTSTKIGSSQTSLGYHGYISLLVYVAAPLIESGAWHTVKGSYGKSVKRGAGVGAARAANKGAVGAAFRFHSQTLSVVSCHLAADKKGGIHAGKRLRDTCKLLEGLELEQGQFEGDQHLSCHHLVILGDLNFRVALPVEEAVEHLARGDLMSLLKEDELAGAMRQGDVLHGFRDACWPIRFVPSFRRVEGEDGRMTNHEVSSIQAFASAEEDEQASIANVLSVKRIAELYTLAAKDGTERTPSYTDRVLLHSLPGLESDLTCSRYQSDETLVISDHRPVSADLTWSTDKMQKALVDNVSGSNFRVRCILKLWDLRIVPKERSSDSVTKMEEEEETVGDDFDGTLDRRNVARVQILLPLPSEQGCTAVLDKFEKLLVGKPTSSVNESGTNTVAKARWEDVATSSMYGDSESDSDGDADSDLDGDSDCDSDGDTNSGPDGDTDSDSEETIGISAAFISDGPPARVHALLMLLDADGADLGQAVIGVAPPPLTSIASGEESIRLNTLESYSPYKENACANNDDNKHDIEAPADKEVTLATIPDDDVECRCSSNQDMHVRSSDAHLATTKVRTISSNLSVQGKLVGTIHGRAVVTWGVI